MKTTQVYYHQGKFWYNEKGWPVKPESVDSLRYDYAYTKERADALHWAYGQSLGTSLKEAVEFEDQEAIKRIIKESWHPEKSGLYTIPETEVEIVKLQSAKQTENENWVFDRVARIIQPEQKEESQEEREAKEDKLWFEFLYDVGSRRHLLAGETEPEQWEQMRKVLEEKWTITISRKS